MSDAVRPALYWILRYVDGWTAPEWYSVILIAGAALLFVILERLIPYNAGQPVLREGFFNDLALYTIAQSYILGIIIFSGIIRLLDEGTGLSRMRLVGNWPVWVQLVFFTVTHDFYIYWMHRWQHNNRWLWRIHEAHHSPTEVDWLSGARSHAIEILINQTVEFTPIVLLGASPEVVAYKGIISAVWGMFIHANLNVSLGRVQRLINGPGMHRWHHAHGSGRNNNFSTKLALWDWLFGTAYLPEDATATAYGLTKAFPRSFAGQFLHAFRRMGRRQTARR